LGGEKEKRTRGEGKEGSAQPTRKTHDKDPVQEKGRKTGKKIKKGKAGVAERRYKKNRTKAQGVGNTKNRFNKVRKRTQRKKGNTGNSTEQKSSVKIIPLIDGEPSSPQAREGSKERQKGE